MTFAKKICKSKGGLTRHINAKHKAGNTENKEPNPHVFTHEIFKSVVCNALEKIAGNKCLESSLKEELASYDCQKSISMMAKERFTEIAKISFKIEQSGNIEKFYSDYYSTVCLMATNDFINLSCNAATDYYYSTVCLMATNYFINLSCNSATLLATTVAEFILVYYQRKAAEVNDDLHILPGNSPSKSVLSSMEIAGLHYLGGYVLHNLHRKLKNSNLLDTQANSQSVAILQAAKLDNVTAETHELVGCLNRGSLWAITSQAQKLIENHFRACTIKPNLKKIDLETIVSKSFTDSELLSNYEMILTETDSDKNVAADLLQNITTLYVMYVHFHLQRTLFRTLNFKERCILKPNHCVRK